MSITAGQPSSDSRRRKYEAMPTLPCEARSVYEHSYGKERYFHYTQIVNKIELKQIPQPTPPLSYQPYHDAESTFWLLAWCLGRAAPENTDDRDEYDSFYRDFYIAMMRQQRRGDAPDPRIPYCLKGAAGWKLLLHSRLESVGPMLREMGHYFLGEWLYRPELPQDHAHEAMQRLLLAEILRMRDEGESGDRIELAGRRRLPSSELDYGYTRITYGTIASTFMLEAQLTRDTILDHLAPGARGPRYFGPVYLDGERID